MFLSFKPGPHPGLAVARGVRAGDGQAAAAALAAGRAGQQRLAPVRRAEVRSELAVLALRHAQFLVIALHTRAAARWRQVSASPLRSVSEVEQDLATFYNRQHSVTYISH